MTLELSRRTADADNLHFRPADHLLGIVQRIVTAHDNARIVLPGNGEVVILPERGEYYTNVQDAIEFSQASATQFVVTSLGEAALPHASGPAKNINVLLWQAAFHASRGRLLESCSKYDVVQFRHWPNLTRLPVTPNAARICSLLTRHPTTIMHVYRMLGIDKAEVNQIYSAAYSAGIVNIISRRPSASLEAVAADTQPEPVKEYGLFWALFAKISKI